MVVKMQLEPLVEPIFHNSSFGYRPGRSPLHAVGQARQNCFTYPWVMEFDIKGLFDNIDHDLLMKAVHKHTQEKWVIRPHYHKKVF
jgi:RNA-directed DNA polymerase